MRTIACVVCTLLVTVSSLVAHIDVDQAIQSAAVRCAVTSANTECIVRAPVVNAPFSAEATTVWQPPASTGQASLHATARYYRDSAGRVRVEQSLVGQGTRAQHIILVPEADSKTAYVLDPAARTASTPVPRGLAQMMVGDGGLNQFVLLKSMRRFLVFFVRPDNVESVSGPSEGSLGQSSIEGIRVTGTRFVTRVPGSDNGRAERWVSPELKLVVYSRSEDTHYGVLEYQLTNISRSEPRAELFEVPEGYKETPFEYPVAWSGPYAPERTKSQ
jgi:hypothetical protein